MENQMSVEIRVTEEEVAVDSPYDRSFISEAKNIGGRWDAGRKVWKFDPRDEDRVRDICMEIYGEDGREPEATVSIRLSLKGWYAWSSVTLDNEIRIAGRKLAHRPSRDAKVRLSPNVIVVEGTFDSSGGSRKNPQIGAAKDVVLEIRDLQASTVAKIKEEAGTKAVEVLDNTNTEKRKAIAKLRTALGEAISAGIDLDTIVEMAESFEDVPF